MVSIGILREEKHFEARTPLTPAHVKDLYKRNDIKTFIQPSKLRTYTDQQYEEAGAVIEEKIWQKADFIFGIKEIPIDLIHPEKTYIFFSHTIKGQAYNMPLLKRILSSGSTLIDYEKITTDENRRLIYFGNYAGFAGMIDTFWAYGQRLLAEGRESPFQNVKQAYQYNSLDEARAELKKLGDTILSSGTGVIDHPLIIGILGYGNVSKGTQEIIDCFPNEEIRPENLVDFYINKQFSTNKVYKVVFYEKHLVKPKDSSNQFDLNDYYNNPEKYESQFSQYLSYITILVNAIYWDTPYPRFVNKDLIKHLFTQKNEKPNLKVIGDISCDVGGAVEVNLKSTAIDEPVYVFDVGSKKAVTGVKGNGPVILAVDNLPCELPKESSTFFGSKLKELLPNIVFSNFEQSFEELDIPKEIKKAIIAYKGELTPNFTYLNKFIQN